MPSWLIRIPSIVGKVLLGIFIISTRSLVSFRAVCLGKSVKSSITFFPMTSSRKSPIVFFAPLWDALAPSPTLVCLRIFDTCRPLYTVTDATPAGTFPASLKAVSAAVPDQPDASNVGYTSSEHHRPSSVVDHSPSSPTCSLAFILLPLSPLLPSLLQPPTQPQPHTQPNSR
ncbi:hypothetical protein K474DRAFT_1708506 [Panus rudis PR-1116 ss-1]|nr:hypothetical protein K474DRAFT_1708506 [Panus rudis PR-1116 ss-1]